MKAVARINKYIELFCGFCGVKRVKIYRTVNFYPFFVRNHI